MSALGRRGSTRRWRQIRAAILDRDGHVCQIRTPGVCVLWAHHVDHVVPRAAGGTDDPGNLRAACAPCNLARRTPAGSFNRTDGHPGPRVQISPQRPANPTRHRRLIPDPDEP